MGIGFRLNFRWVSSLKYPYSTNSSSWPSSYSFRGMETSYDTARVSFPYNVLGETETMYNDHLRSSSCPSAALTLSNDYLETEHVKINIKKSSCGGISCIIDSNFHKPAEGDQVTSATSVLASKGSHFGVLMNNLYMLEKTFADSDMLRLESDILLQLDRLGALKLFHTCLLRTRSPSLVDRSVTECHEEHQMKNNVNGPMAKIAVRSGKKEKRKAKRVKASQQEKDVYLLPSPSKTNHMHHQHQTLSSARRSSGSKPKITRNEAELTVGVKLVANLEKIRMLLEKETGEKASLASWAEAANVDKKTLQQNLHFGCYCKNELLKSTRSLIVYIARNYRGLGVGFEDLIQAGSIGVLQGAERFDHTRGYRFSTYIQYWIRKSILMLVERNSRGVRIPYALSKTVKKIQKARKTLCNSLGTYPDDYEIAKSTGLSLSKITSASNCLRVIGSLDQKIGDFTSVKFLELMPDTSIKGPEETVMRQHLVKDMYDLLDALDPRERQVLLLRLGLQNNHCMSLQEIGRLFSVSKEWIRKIERTALTKLRDQETLYSLNHYLYM